MQISLWVFTEWSQGNNNTVLSVSEPLDILYQITCWGGRSEASCKMGTWVYIATIIVRRANEIVRCIMDEDGAWRLFCGAISWQITKAWHLCFFWTNTSSLCSQVFMCLALQLCALALLACRLNMQQKCVTHGGNTKTHIQNWVVEVELMILRYAVVSSISVSLSDYCPNTAPLTVCCQCGFFKLFLFSIPVFLMQFFATLALNETWLVESILLRSWLQQTFSWTGSNSQTELGRNVSTSTGRS